MTGGRVALAVALATLLAPSAARAAATGVLVVGDSLEVGTGPHLERELRGVDVEIDAKTSRPSSVGLRVLRSRLRPSHGTVVFDLGTNDDPSRPQELAGRLGTVRELVADRCLVLVTVNRPPLRGVPVDGLNRVIQEFALETPGAQLVEWQEAVASERSLLGRDGVHATPAGYAARARLVAEAVTACRGGDDLEADETAPLPDLPQVRGGAAADSPGVDLAAIGRLGAVSAQFTFLRGLSAGLDAATRAVSRAVTGPPHEEILGAPER